MSVVAACILNDRVLIAADCRLTVEWKGTRRHYDNLLKVYPCGPYSVLGFVGDVSGASKIVRKLLLQLMAEERRERAETRPLPSSHLSHWLPRCLRWAYADTKTRGRVGFMLASIVPRPKNGAGGDGAGGYEGRVDFLQSPLFQPEATGACAIPVMGGSGGAHRRAAIAVMGSGGPLTVQGLTQNAEFFRVDEAAHLILDRAIANCSVAADIDTVGGLRPTYEISLQGVRAVEYRSYGDGADEICLEHRSPELWIQRNVTIGTSCDIVPPWQLTGLPDSSQTFDNDFF